MSSEESRVKYLEIKAVSKGLHECLFRAKIKEGDQLVLERKVGERGQAFKIMHEKGQIGHLQQELVSILWRLSFQTRITG